MLVCSSTKNIILFSHNLCSRTERYRGGDKIPVRKEKARRNKKLLAGE